MSSMIEEIEVPKPSVMIVCPCCRFSFSKLEAFVAHCEAMKTTIDAAIAKARKK